MKLAQLKDEFSKYIVLRDPWVLDMIIGTVIGNSLIERDPIWTMVVAPSSGGKSTLLAPLSGLGFVHFIDDMTEKTLISGYKLKGKDMSLLSAIGSKGVMAFSDFTSILSKNPLSRGEILTQLKLVYDGKLTKFTGTGKGAWDGKIGFIGAATPDIYTMLESSRSMGERFVYYWMEQPTDGEIADKQKEVKLSAKNISLLMEEHYKDYCRGVSQWVEKHGVPELQVTDEQRARIRKAVIFCVNGKATVHTDIRTGFVDQIPNKAGIGRDNKMFDALMLIMQIMDAYETDNPDMVVSDERVSMIEKCAYSSITREKRKLLEILANAPQSGLNATEIGASEGLGLSKKPVERLMDPLHAVGLVRKVIAGRTDHRWVLGNDNDRDFILSVSKNVTESLKVQGIQAGYDDETDDEYGSAETEVDILFNS